MRQAKLGAPVAGGSGCGGRDRSHSPTPLACPSDAGLFALREMSRRSGAYPGVKLWRYTRTRPRETDLRLEKPQLNGHIDTLCTIGASLQDRRVTIVFGEQWLWSSSRSTTSAGTSGNREYVVGNR
jgi:hypothetical protein